MEIDYNEDSNASSDYSLLGRMYKSKSLPGGEFNQDEEYYQVPGWDSGVGSDCFPGVDMDGGDIPGGEFASEGSGVMPSEEQNSGCTCDEQNQPDHVKVIIAKNGNNNTGHAASKPPTDQKLRELRTLKQHYYPEGGWGWVIVCVTCLVHLLVVGSQIVLASIIISLGKPNTVSRRLHPDVNSAAISVSLCRHKSTRLTAVSGGLIMALSCLFSSFATQFHQLIISLGLIQGIGVSFTRDSASLMLGQYFKRRREMVEMFIVSSPGIGIVIISKLVHNLLRKYGWRLGLQMLTLLVTSTFFLGMFYRSASLYHPQRRAIMHLKNQKRKIKMKKDDKSKLLEEKVPVVDFYVLKSKTIKILLTSTAVTSLGINTPVFYLIEQASFEGMKPSQVEMLQLCLGLAWSLGCVVFGLMVVRKSDECSVSRQYLTQAANILCGAALLALTQVKGHSGYMIFVWVYGLFLGGHQYSLKMYLFEKVRARNFANAWGFVQFSQGLSLLLGVPITGYINQGCGGCKAGYYFSAICVLTGGGMMALIDIQKRLHRSRRKSRHRRKSRDEESSNNMNTLNVTTEKEFHNTERRNSFPDIEEEVYIPHFVERNPHYGYDDIDMIDFKKPELTCISEEGIADMELPDNLLDDLEILENITSCNKVENYLMLSEYEQNLSKENDSEHEQRESGSSHGKKSRKWSLVRQNSTQHDTAEDGGQTGVSNKRRRVKQHNFKPSWRYSKNNSREITTIAEDSV